MSLVAEVAVPGFVDAAVVNGTAYGYAVSAFGAGGESAVSSSVVVTPVAPEPEPEPEVPLGSVGCGWCWLVMRRCRWSGMVLLVPMGIGCIARRRRWCGVVRWLRLRCRGLSMLRW